MSDKASGSGLADGVMALGALCFAAALVLTGLAYTRDFGLPVDAWSNGPGLHAIFIDTALFALFAAHHSVFARTPVRRRVARLVSEPLERSVYVLTASVLLLAVVWFWIPVPGQAWAATGWGAVALGSAQIAGVVLTLVAAEQLGIARLSGLSRSQPAAVAPAPLRATGLYAFVRHPIYFAWLLMVWPAPAMTGSRLTFAALSTLYLALAVPFEERTLRAQFGPAYDAYKRTVRWRMMPGVY